MTTGGRTTAGPPTALTTTGLTITGAKQKGQGGSSLAVTGTTLQIELLLAGSAIGLGTLLILMSRPRRWPRWRFPAS